MATKESKLRKLLDDSMAVGGLPEYRKNFEQSIGVHTDATGRKYFDKDKRDVDYMSLEIGRVCQAMLGNDWRSSFEQTWQQASQLRFEGVGGTVTTGDLPYTGAAIDTIAGLANARALERPSAPQWIWDNMCTPTEIVGEGGFEMIVRSNGDYPAQDLADGEPLPTVFLKGSRVHRNRTLNQGLRTKISKWTILDDLTGSLYGAVDENSDLVLMERERKVADAVLGVGAYQGTGPQNIGLPGYSIPVIQDGLLFFPYQTGLYNNPGASAANYGGALSSPQTQKLVANFANAATNDTYGLQDYTFLVRALSVLAANRDPWTNLPIEIPLMGMTMFVAPRAIPQVRYILQTKEEWQIQNGGISTSNGTNTVSTLNLLSDYNFNVVSSQVWANRLVDVGIQKATPTAGTIAFQTFTNAAADTFNTSNSIASFFCMGHFKEAVKYAVRTPYTVQQVPLSSVEYAEEVVLIQDVRERGQAFIVNPRKMYRAYA